MQEITGISLDNEMDITLAHRSSMKLAELAGLSTAQQTTFATAIAELLRYAIDIEQNGHISLGIENKEREKYLVATLSNTSAALPVADNQGLTYARRLISNIDLYTEDDKVLITLKQKLPSSLKITDTDTRAWSASFNNDKHFSAYDEVKRKNRQLLELAEQLRESDSQYRIVTDSLPLMIFSATTNGELMYINKWMSEYAGLTMSQFNAKGWKKVVYKDDLPLVSGMWNEPTALEAGFFSKEFRVRHNETGNYLWHRTEGILLKDEIKGTPYWTGFIVDINADRLNKELKETQRMLNHKIEELNRSNKELEEFAYVASHDLQEPLRKIIFYSDFLKKKYLKDINTEANGFLDKMSGAAIRMKKLISDLLAFSTINQKKSAVTSVVLNTVLQEALQDLEIIVNEKKAVITFDDLPEIEASHLQMRQLFENLISNALKYSVPGVPPHVTISCKTEGNQSVISFSDNGIGMEPKYSEKVFGLFQRLHTSEEYSGTGLGLAICKKIVVAHHGTISVVTQPGLGSNFIVQLPLKQAT